jgi:hypothetical protein
MDVSVISSAIGRELYRQNGFVFESFGQDDKAITDDGKKQFLTTFKSQVESDPTIAGRINGVRYKIRPMRVRTA